MPHEDAKRNPAAAEPRLAHPETQSQISMRVHKTTEMQVCHREARVELNGGAHHIRDGKISRFPLFQHVLRCPDRFPMLFGVFFIVFA